jgi:hypothetical protein
MMQISEEFCIFPMPDILLKHLLQLRHRQLLNLRQRPLTSRLILLKTAKKLSRMHQWQGGSGFILTTAMRGWPLGHPLFFLF